MFIAIRKEPNGELYIDKNYFKKFQELKFGFSKAEVPDEFFEEVSPLDFNKNLQFSHELFIKNREQVVLKKLREMRIEQCFDIVNRGVLWYNTLTEEQRLELDKWYKEWLDITDKYVYGVVIDTIIPKRPEWLK